jgi:hypothetical protein
MQGRQDQGNKPWDKPSEPKLLSLTDTGQHRVARNPNEGTSKHQAIKEQIQMRTSEMRAIPKRPPTMTRVDTPPELPRAPRPQRETIEPKKLHKRLLILGSIFVVLAIIASVVGYFLASSISSSTGPSTVVTDFLTAINNKDYAQAYKDLGPAITIRLSQEQFAQQAQSVDTCYGAVKDFSEVANSAQTQDDGQTYIYTYTLTRAQLAKSYNLQITLQKDPDDNSWKVSDYGTGLGPAQPAPACHK